MPPRPPRGSTRTHGGLSTCTDVRTPARRQGVRHADTPHHPHPARPTGRAVTLGLALGALAGAGWLVGMIYTLITWQL
ncbi:morphogenic membrane protein MmpA [Streptomyces sp. MNU103]|uniref:morphogenic membrane protein MmpA n=1 Tax=Streptomyces sp. MNU103 TaxID=2560024 RepID=UPI003FD59CB3